MPTFLVVWLDVCFTVENSPFCMILVPHAIKSSKSFHYVVNIIDVVQLDLQ